MPVFEAQFDNFSKEWQVVVRDYSGSRFHLVVISTKTAQQAKLLAALFTDCMIRVFNLT